MAKDKKEKKGIIKEFKEFITRGNVLDMAVGVIIAGAFGKITASLVNDVVMPFIGWIFGGADLTKLNIVLREAVMDGEEVVKEAVTIGIGTFISTIIDFIIIALIVFLIVRAFNRAREAAEKKKAEKEAAEAAEAEAAPEEPAAPTTEELLTEIRDLLREGK